MVNESRGANGERDILAVWIAEDVLAFAKSFGIEPTGAFKEAVKRIESESLLKQGDSDSENPEEFTRGDRPGR